MAAKSTYPIFRALYVAYAMFYKGSVSIVYRFEVDGLPSNPNQYITLSYIVPHFHPFPLHNPYPFPYGFPINWRALQEDYQKEVIFILVVLYWQNNTLFGPSAGRYWLPVMECSGWKCAWQWVSLYIYRPRLHEQLKKYYRMFMM